VATVVSVWVASAPAPAAAPPRTPAPTPPPRKAEITDKDEVVVVEVVEVVEAVEPVEPVEAVEATKSIISIEVRVAEALHWPALSHSGATRHPHPGAPSEGMSAAKATTVAATATVAGSRD